MPAVERMNQVWDMEGDPETVIAPDLRGYVIRAEPRKERQAAGGLIGHRIKIWLPEIPSRRLCGRKMRQVWIPMLPGYLIALLPPGFDDWGRIRTTPGVMPRDPVLGGYRPIRDKEISILKEAMRLEIEGPAPFTSPYKEGDAVDIAICDSRHQIVDWVRGKVRDISRLRKHGQVKATAEMLGKLMELNVELSQLRPA
jgi:hypothetical protein